MSDSDKPMLLTIVSVLTPLVIGALGIYFTNVYKEQETGANRINQERLALERQQRLLLDKASVVKQYFEYLANKADENQQQAAQASGTDNVAIVAGADKSLESAQTEVDKLKAAGFTDAQVLKRGDWYRTVVPVQTNEDSAAALGKIKSQVRQSAYAVDLNKWCEKTPNGTDCNPPGQ